jgi:predicted solute-binding protein
MSQKHVLRRLLKTNQTHAHLSWSINEFSIKSRSGGEKSCFFLFRMAREQRVAMENENGNLFSFMGKSN